METIGFIPHTRCQRLIFYIRWYVSISRDEVLHRTISSYPHRFYVNEGLDSQFAIFVPKIVGFGGSLT